MPMFYGQIKIQNYLNDPAISFSAIGDGVVELNPALQVSEFGQGKEVDQLISKLFLVGNGGGNEKESFELAAYFYKERCKLLNAEFPFFFVTGDEGFYDQSPKKYFQDTFGIDIGHAYASGRDIWGALMTKYNVFHLKKAYISQNKEAIIKKQWVDTIGKERVLQFVDPKACVDVMLGVISMTTGVRTLDEYVRDMKQREQTKTRIDEVVEVLTPYWTLLQSGNAGVVKFVNEGGVASSSATATIVSNIQLKIPTDKLQELREITEKFTIGFNLSQDRIDYYKALKSLSIEKANEIKKELVCPITNQLFFDPVTAPDGITYESKAISCWLANNETSPVTGEVVEGKEVVSNNVISKLVEAYYNDYLASLSK